MPTVNVYLDEATYIKLVHISVDRQERVTALIQEVVRKWLEERSRT